MQFFLSILSLLAGSIVFYGWGSAVRRVSRAPTGSAPVTVALGVAAVILLGGVANLARVAYAPTLWVIAAAGIVLCVVTLRARPGFGLSEIRPLWSSGPAATIEFALAAVFIAAVIGFAVVTQVPPDIFNAHDDFQKYFVHPIRMLATGTLFAHPLNALGLQTFGGLAVLHGAVLSLAPLPFINGVDAVFGLLLLLMLAASAGWRRLSPLPGALLGPLLIVMVNPQYVNTSALFLGAALMAAAVMLVSDEREGASPSTIAVGMLYAALVALKPTFGLFALLHLPLSALAVAAAQRSVWVGFGWGWRAALSAAVAFSPWLLLHLPNYLHMRTAPDGPIGDVPAESFGLLFSIKPFFYDSSAAHYTAMAGLALLSALWAVLALVRGDALASRKAIWGIASASIGVVVMYVLLGFVLAPQQSGIEQGVRYSIPFLLAVVPVVVVFSAALPSPLPRIVTIGVPAAALLAAAIAFVPSANRRFQQLAEKHTLLAFSPTLNEVYADYVHAGFARPEADLVRKIQQTVPAGQPIFAWINRPIHFDFVRNPIYETELGGIGAPWGVMPDDVQYFVWEYGGLGVRTEQDYVSDAANLPGRLDRLLAARALAFARQLNADVPKGRVLYADKRFVLYQLAKR
jgi:hypothetical protein